MKLPLRINPQSPTAVFDADGVKVAATKEGHGFHPIDEEEAEANAALLASMSQELVRLRAEIERLTPYVEAFAREEERADRAQDDITQLHNQVERQQWKPIETAPTGDDDFFLVCGVGDERPAFVVRGAILASARKPNTPSHLNLHWLTHWMPIPALPSTENPSGGDQ